MHFCDGSMCTLSPLVCLCHCNCVMPSDLEGDQNSFLVPKMGYLVIFDQFCSLPKCITIFSFRTKKYHFRWKNHMSAHLGCSADWVRSLEPAVRKSLSRHQERASPLSNCSLPLISRLSQQFTATEQNAE